MAPTENPDMSHHSSEALAAFIGNDPTLRAVLARARLIAPTQMPVLVTGESGTGKELMARVLHELGPRPGGPFVAVNCGALARELAESELFGHERGAFTGAGGRRAGWFEEASGGTLVLDEIGELPLDLQPKLLRVLETGRLRRVGGTGEVPVAVRVVAMTLRDLRRETARGSFRIDLYHRLAGFELTLPPLRRRPADIPLLAQHFLPEAEAEVGPRVLDPGAMGALLGHGWPGNVRELRNVIRRAAILTGARIDVDALALEEPGCELRLVDSHETRTALAPVTRAADAAQSAPAPPGEGWVDLRGKNWSQLQDEIFRWALRRNGGSRRRAAVALGISRSTFCERVKRLALG